MSSGDNPDDQRRTRARLAEIRGKLPEPEEADVEPLDEPEQETAEQSADEAFDEDYDEHIDGEDLPPPKPDKPRRLRGWFALGIVLIIIIIWTTISPEAMPRSGDTYLNSQRYANLSGFSGEVNTWAGNSTWAISVSGSDTTSVGAVLNISVLISKVSDDPANGWFQGTAITLKEASVYLAADGTRVGVMTNKSDIGFGILAYVPITLSEPGNHVLYAFVKFVMYTDMVIGYLPLKAVEIESEHFLIAVV